MGLPHFLKQESQSLCISWARQVTQMSKPGWVQAIKRGGNNDQKALKVYTFKFFFNVVHAYKHIRVQSSHSAMNDFLRPKKYPKLVFYKDISVTLNSMKAKKIK